MKIRNLYLEEVCQRLSDKFNDNFNIPVYVDDLRFKTLGQCCWVRYKPTEIIINRQLIETGVAEDILNTIKHEWAHYYLMKYGYYTCHTRSYHNLDFQILCQKIGCDYHAHATEGYAEYSKTAKYAIYCPDCDRIVAGYEKKCKAVKEVDHYRCGFCKGSHLKVIERN